MAVVPGRNAYCGPFAVGYCADVSPDTIEAYVARNVEAMSVWEMQQTLEAFRVPYVTSHNHLDRRTCDCPTIRAWFRQVRREKQSACYMVVVSGHVVIIDNGILYDNAHPKGIEVGCYEHKRDRVLIALEVQKRIRFAKAA